jgi:hypothetical protein
MREQDVNRNCDTYVDDIAKDGIVVLNGQLVDVNAMRSRGRKWWGPMVAQ